MEQTTLTVQFQHFLLERPAISIGKLAKELQFDRVNLQKIVAGYRNIPQAKRGDFSRIMEKYGYHFDMYAKDILAKKT